MENLDQFYTKKNTANQCYTSLKTVLKNALKKNEKDFYYIEPSAGNCDFFNLLPDDRKTGIDLQPPSTIKKNVIVNENFLAWYYRPFHYPRNKVIIIGNPPFGKKGKMALEFIEKAGMIADTVAFVLPILFRKYLTQKNINKDLSLIYDEKLPINSFYTLDKNQTINDYALNCVFQIWTRLPLKNISYMDLRIKTAPPTNHPDIDMWQYNATKEAKKVFNNDFDFAVLRQGYSGFNQKKYKDDIFDLKKQWILFKAKTLEAKAILKSIDFSKLAEKNTTSIKGFGKADVVAEYIRLKFLA